MPSEPALAITVDQLSKHYYLRGHGQELKTALLSLPAMLLNRRGRQEFWALQDISFSMERGECLGLCGLNGSGKSTLLRLLAGVDRDFEGETVLQPGYTVGFLEQEPLQRETRSVREVVEEGVGEVVALVQEYETLSERLADPMEPDEMDRVLERQGDVQEQLEGGRNA